MNVLAKRTIRKQSGAALLAFLLVFLTAASFALIKGLNETATQQHRDAQTAKALAEAKAALIGRAAGGNIVEDNPCTEECRRPGDLPCPDMNNDGSTDAGSCTSQDRRLGRLPWRTLGLPDLRDGSGERLWYAVSDNFKNNNRTTCGSSGDAGCLNSDSRGTISVRRPDDSFLHDGSSIDPYVKSGAVAVVIAAGPVLQRLGATSSQDRRCTVCNSNDICTASPPTNVPRCQPQNYLDTTAGAGEDNAAFGDNTLDGFIQGDVVDTNGEVIVNDRLLAITYQDLMPLMEKRVVGEVLTCLKEYADPSAPNNQRYPWAAKLGSSGSAPEYSDDSGYLFGRLPDGQSPGFAGASLDDTKTAIGLAAWNYWPNKDIVTDSNCKLTSIVSPNTWWLNWKEHVFYGVAEGFQPDAFIRSGCGSGPPPNSCLTVSPPSSSADKKVVVIAAGKRLQAVPSGQPRNNADKADIGNYLEDENMDYVDDGIVTPNENMFTSKAVSNTFNDVVCNNGNCL